MKIEHFALNVADPPAMAAWYEKHLGLKTVRKLDGAPHTHFITDDGGNVLLEIYNNPPDQVPDYPRLNHLQLHLAFVSADPERDKARLLAAGATGVVEDRLPDGSLIITLRDPWGFTFQLCKRGKSMLRDY